MLYLVIDTSVFIDSLFEYDPVRTSRAKRIFKLVDTGKHVILEPIVFRIELIAQLVRRKPRRSAQRIYRKLVSKVVIVDEIDYANLFKIALNTGCRAIDTFYIATAEMANAILVTADRIMAENTRKYGGIDAYYIHNPLEFKELIKVLG